MAACWEMDPPYYTLYSPGGFASITASWLHCSFPKLHLFLPCISFYFFQSEYHSVHFPQIWGCFERTHYLASEGWGWWGSRSLTIKYFPLCSKFSSIFPLLAVTAWASMALDCLVAAAECFLGFVSFNYQNLHVGKGNSVQ